MKLPIRLAARTLFLGLCGTQVVALGVGSLLPPEQALRSECATQPMVLHEGFVATKPGWPVLVDPDTTDAQSLGMGEGEHLEQVSCSPWKDERGQRQVAGLWYRTKGETVGQLSQVFGLARCTFPGGRVLDRIETDILPQSPPCWYPGSIARVLFAGQNGRLYRYAFEAERGPGENAAGEPEPIAWHAGRTEFHPAEIGDLVWPTDPRLGGRLIASLRLVVRDAQGRHQSSNRQLWWLQLDRSGSTMIGAGRLTLPSASQPSGAQADERYPALGVANDGSPVLAYMTHNGVMQHRRWQLRLAPVEFDMASHEPRVRERLSQILAHGCAPVTPAFSTDSQKLLCLSYTSEAGPRLRQLALTGGPGSNSAVTGRLEVFHRPLSPVTHAGKASFSPERVMPPALLPSAFTLLQ